MRCSEVCPSGAIALKQGAVDSPDSSWCWVLDPKSCIFCGYCAEDCPNGALTLGREFALAERARGLRSVEGQPEDVTRIFGRSVHIRHLDAGSCNGCDWEMTTLTGPVYDVQRPGFDFAASPMS